MSENQNQTGINLKQLRHQAKDLLKSAKSGNLESFKRFQNKHPLFLNQSQEHILSQITLADAQCVIARENGYGSWPKLKAALESKADHFSEVNVENLSLPKIIETLDTIGVDYQLNDLGQVERLGFSGRKFNNHHMKILDYLPQLKNYLFPRSILPMKD